MSDQPKQFTFTHRGHPFELRVTADGTLELRLDGVLRKDRPAGAAEPQYVWTNVELEWEEHHYIEARYWRSTGALTVTVNREPLYEVVLGG
ncbi:MAG: hypothetical protein AAGI15_04165 [Pseudomonadota bacterium]